MKIAIVGGGIAGLGAAWSLWRDHEVHLYEAASKPGGHANTVEVDTPIGRVSVDTGFIVYNEPNYPNLTRLFAALEVPTAWSDMSFAVSLGEGRREYKGSPLGLFAQPRNLLSRRHWGMVRDMLRFYREAPELLAALPGPALSLGDYLATKGFGGAFRDRHLLPMAAAIWSSSPERILSFPAQSFVRFFANHGLLEIGARPRWRTVQGGSREYVRRLLRGHEGQLRLATPIVSVRRDARGAEITTGQGHREHYDAIVLATHADSALKILGSDADAQERQVLGAFHYLRNDALLHSDPRLMPKRRTVWASWNYLGQSAASVEGRSAVTYWMNRLQNLDQRAPLFVTLNSAREPDPAKLHGRFVYDHPQFDRAALEAQESLPLIQGRRSTWFCGSYCGYGFHEDALQAGLSVAAALGSPAPWAKEIVPTSPAARAAMPLAPLAAAAE